MQLLLRTKRIFNCYRVLLFSLIRHHTQGCSPDVGQIGCKCTIFFVIVQVFCV